MDRTYPKSHVTMIMGLNALSFLVGLGVLAAPFARGLLLGSFETTVSVALGALIATLAVFRMLLGYGAIWIDILLAAFGVLIFLKPTYMHMHWNASYTTAHYVGGAILLGVAIVSALMTMPVLKKLKHA